MLNPAVVRDVTRTVCGSEFYIHVCGRAVNSEVAVHVAPGECSAALSSYHERQSEDDGQLLWSSIIYA